MLTAKQKEQKLNETYLSCYTEDEAVEAFIYMTNKDRGSRVTTEKHIRKCYREGRLGSLLRANDPIAFNCSD